MRLPIYLLLITITLSGCTQRMHEEGRVRPLQKDDFFSDERSARPPVAGTIARGHLKPDDVFHTGILRFVRAKVLLREDASVYTLLPVYSTEAPIKVSREAILKGQERFNILCAVCHDRTGRGNGMIVQRGYPKPPSYHIDRLRQAPIGYLFYVMTNGLLQMRPYADVLSAEERWQVALYIRALQISQNATMREVAAEQRGPLLKMEEQSGEDPGGEKQTR